MWQCLPETASHPNSRLVTLDQGHHERFSTLFTLELDIDLPSLHTVFLPKPPSVDLPNAFIAVIIFFTALLLTRGTHFVGNEVRP